MYDYMCVLYFQRKGLLNFQCLTRNYATFLSNMYKYILNMYMYIIHMHCTVCKERPLLLKADAFLIRIMDLVCNLPKRQLKFLADIRENSNYIITVHNYFNCDRKKLRIQKMLHRQTSSSVNLMFISIIVGCQRLLNSFNTQQKESRLCYFIDFHPPPLF